MSTTRTSISRHANSCCSSSLPTANRLYHWSRIRPSRSFCVIALLTAAILWSASDALNLPTTSSKSSSSSKKPRMPILHDTSHHHASVSSPPAPETTFLVGLQPRLSSSSCEDSSAAADSNSIVEWEMHVGKAMDTLRTDYPDILVEAPDYSIYDPMLEIIDPSGVTVHGIKSYKNAFRLLHAVLKVFYCPAKSSITFRMCYDQARQNIRIHWNAAAVPREFFGGLRKTLHVDGISVYELDRDTGNITQHRIEHLLMNNVPVAPEEGVIAALEDHHTVTVPSYIANGENQVLQFQQLQPINYPWITTGRRKKASLSLFAMEASSSSGGDSSSDLYPGLDWTALERKNKSRKKFGLEPLTPEEFLELEAQVQQMDTQQRQRAAEDTSSSSSDTTSKSSPGGFLEKLFGDTLTDTCESNFDCERPEICCDFGFKKVCCSSGSRVFDGLKQAQLKPVLVPVPVDNGYPPGQGPSDDPRGF